MGQGALDVLGRRRVRALPALGRLPAGRRRRQRPGPTCLAVRRRQQVHRPLPRDPRDLVVRLGLRRQRPAGQEVLRPAHRLDHGPRRRLDGRAHAHPRRHAARRREAVRRRRVPVGVRQDQHGDDDPDPAGLEGRDRRRRHRLDEVRRRRPALRHQPRGRVLRRRPGHGRRHQPERHAPRCTATASSPTWPRPTTATCGGRACRRPAGPPHRLEGQRLDARQSDAPAAHPNARFTAPGVAVPVDRPRVGGPEGRADLGHPLRRAPGDQRAAGDRVASTGTTACSSARS